MAQRVILISDVDNTVYDFVGFYGKAFRAMVNVVAKQTETPTETITDQFRRVFQQAGTLDFRNLIQNLDVARELPDDLRTKLVIDGRRAYDLSKRKRLHPYDQINEVFRAISRAGVMIIGATNAPFYHAYTRLQNVGTLPFISGLVAWEGVKLRPGDPLFNPIIQDSQEEVHRRAQRHLRFFETFPKERSKPNSYVFELIQKKFGTDASYFVLGDSISKDLAPASPFGMKTIWAKYGSVEDDVNLQTVLLITPWSEAEVQLHSERRYEPDFVVERPSDLLTLIPNLVQLGLF